MLWSYTVYSEDNRTLRNDFSRLPWHHRVTCLEKVSIFFFYQNYRCWPSKNGLDDQLLSAHLCFDGTCLSSNVCEAAVYYTLVRIL